ncbi:MAG TPA: type II toxin-antitoxin system prevent-host-death family antitoxin [bacterium]|jgi:prevent-host-death family protein|nr:type II toxin-antitoxin system prevent-host-death family antitoxin [bacterium]
MKRCQLSYAKARLSGLVSRITGDGPFIITVRGKQKAALVPMEVYDRMYPRSRESLLEFFRRSPLRKENLSLERDRSPMRTVDF